MLMYPLETVAVKLCALPFSCEREGNHLGLTGNPV